MKNKYLDIFRSVSMMAVTEENCKNLIFLPHTRIVYRTRSPYHTHKIHTEIFFLLLRDICVYVLYVYTLCEYNFFFY